MAATITRNEDTQTVEEVFASLAPKPPRGGVLGGLGVLLAGIVGLYLVLAPLGTMPGVAKVPLVLVGVYLCFRGIDSTCKNVWATLRHRPVALRAVADGARAGGDLRRLPAPHRGHRHRQVHHRAGQRARPVLPPPVRVETSASTCSCS